jgi:hypothetical protein
MEKGEMSDQIRKWRLVKSIQWALLIALLAGFVVSGVLANHIVGTLELRESLLAGAGVSLALALLLTALFDSISKTVGQVAHTIKKKTRKNSPKKTADR